MSILSLSNSKKRICKFFISKNETKCEFESDNILLSILFLIKVYSKDGYFGRATINLTTGEYEIKNTRLDLNLIN